MWKLSKINEYPKAHYVISITNTKIFAVFYESIKLIDFFGAIMHE